MDAGPVVTRQLGREPRGKWRVVARCAHGYPTAIATAPAGEAGEPFPTLFYLTCPHLTEAIGELESAGAVGQWRQRLAEDADLAARMRAADRAYRRARAREGGGEDPVSDVGTAGQRDPLATKCLHAHVAAFLGGIGDPVGEAVLGGLDPECADRRCGETG